MTKEIDSGQTNKGFLGDDGKSRIVEAIERNQFTLELTVNQQKEPVVQQPYDPFKERVVQHPTTNFETFIHLIKGSLGTGILAMPNAFNNSGYIIGPIATIIIGVICTYCVHMLMRVQYELCKRLKVPSLHYPAVASSALLEGPKWIRPAAPYAVHIVNIFLLIYQIGICCVYVVFVSFNLKAIADYYTEYPTDIRLVMLILLLPLILINWVRNLKYLAPFSTVGNFVTIVSFSIILYYLFRDPISIDGKEAFGEIANFPLFFGTVLFSLEAIGVMFPLENEMKTPKVFRTPCGVLNNAMGSIIILYVSMGMFGYLRYGDKVQGSVTLNLPEEDVLAQCVKVMLAFAIFITHGLAGYVAIDIAWNDYVVKHITSDRNKLFWEYLLRTFIVLITFLLAIAIPNIELFISLFGALCISFLGLTFPAIFEICTYWYYTKGFSWAWMLFKNIILMLIGLSGLIIGTYTSIAEIIEKVF